MVQVLLDLGKVVLCCLVFFWRFPRREHFAVRVAVPALLGAALMLAIDSIEVTNRLLIFLSFIVEFSVILAVFHSCFETDWEQALYSASAGWATEHLASQLFNLVAVSTNLSSWYPDGDVYLVILYIVEYVPVCAAAYFLFATKMDTSNFQSGDVRRDMNVVSVIIVFVCNGITRFTKGGYTISTVGDADTQIAQCLYAITCCVLCLFIQSDLCKRAGMNKEIELIRMLWAEDGKRMAERKETVELINMKCHDIRHKLNDYHLPLTEAERDEVKSLIYIYDQTYQTGNATLDVLLANNLLLYQASHIQLSFMGDCSCLNFLAETEIYSLFGNALGNAADAVRELEEDKRQVSVIVRGSGDIVSINVTNFYQGELAFEDGLPRTTHTDSPCLHGYGMKSMRAVAQKYGGGLTAKAENGIFELTIWLVNKAMAGEEAEAAE